MPEERDDALDRLLHAEKSGEGRIAAYGPVQKNSAKARVLGRVDHLGLADGCQYPLRRVGAAHRIAAAGLQILRDRHVRLPARLERAGKGVEERVVIHGLSRTVLARFQASDACTPAAGARAPLISNRRPQIGHSLIPPRQHVKMCISPIYGVHLLVCLAPCHSVATLHPATGSFFAIRASVWSQAAIRRQGSVAPAT